MAKVIVTGEVDKVSEYADGNKTFLTIWETYPSPMGEMWTRKWSVWLDVKLDGVSKNDWFELEGNLGTKITKFVNKDGIEKQVIDHNLNSVSIIKHNPVIPKDTTGPDADDRLKYGNPVYGSNAPF